MDTLNGSKAAELARILQAVADPVRLRILNLLARHDATQRQLVQVLQLKPQVVSKHLSQLRAGRFVATSRRGNTGHYIIRWHSHSTESELLRVILTSLRGLPELQADVALLKAIHRQDRKQERQRMETYEVAPLPTLEPGSPLNDGAGPVFATHPPI